MVSTGAGAACLARSFSWPAAFPLSWIHHVMNRSTTLTHVRTLLATGRGHLPVAAGIALGS